MSLVYGLPEVPAVYSVCRDLEVRALRADVLFEVRSIAERVKSSAHAPTLGTDPIISKYRALAGKSGGRPPIAVYPEVLVRGVLLRGRLPRYNSVLDIVNAVSALTRIPISPVDVDRAVLPLKLAYSARDTVVRDFGGRGVYVRRGAIVLEDGVGRIVYVFPYKSTDVAPVTTATKNAAFIGYGAPGVPLSLVESSVRMVVTYIESFVRGASCSRLEVDGGSRCGRA